MQTPWEHRFAQRTSRMQSSAIRELLKLTQQPDLISFAGGLPAPEIFPVEAFAQACLKVLETAGSMALQYSPTEGYLPLREMISRHTHRYHIQISPDNVLLTSGSQQALDLLGKILINPGDRILVDSPTYLGALQAWNAYEAEFIPVACDEHGMLPSALEAALRTGPKFIYVLPNFQNPTGITMSSSRRGHLVKLADQYGVPIIEDDPYGQLRFEGRHLAPVVVEDCRFRGGESEACYQGNVIYLSTFSKILAPGIRLAWVLAPPEIIGKLVQAKQGADLHTATFNQMVAHEVSKGGFLDQHIRLIRKVYGERRDVMLATLEACMPPEVRWTKPKGGLFMWLTLPEGLDAGELLPLAVEQKVAFVPGTPFFPCGGGKNTIRLNFSNTDPGQIRVGIERLGVLMDEFIAE